MACCAGTERPRATPSRPSTSSSSRCAKRRAASRSRWTTGPSATRPTSPTSHVSSSSSQVRVVSLLARSSRPDPTHPSSRARRKVLLNRHPLGPPLLGAARAHQVHDRATLRPPAQPTARARRPPRPGQRRAQAGRDGAPAGLPPVERASPALSPLSLKPEGVQQESDADPLVLVLLLLAASDRGARHRHVAVRRLRDLVARVLEV